MDRHQSLRASHRCRCLVHTFFSGTKLGHVFPGSNWRYLSVIYGVEKRDHRSFGWNLRGGSCFQSVRSITEADGTITETRLLLTSWFRAGTWILQLAEAHFPKQHQVSITEPDTVAGWRTIPDGILHLQRALNLVERKGLIDVDRHMDVVVTPKMCG